MVYIKFHGENFDFEFETKNNDEIIEEMSNIFLGRKVKGNHNSVIHLKNREEKVELWNIIRNSDFFHCIVDCRLSKDEIDLMILKIWEGMEK